MAPSTTPVNAGIHDPGSIHSNVSTLAPLSQGQHGNTDKGSGSPNIAMIVGGVVGPLIVIGIVGFIIYIWYRRKYPVRMVLGRDFAKFSNPAYNTRQSTLTLVREDGEKEWDNLTNPNNARGATKDSELEGCHNAAFEEETETTVPDDYIHIKTEDLITNPEQDQQIVEEKEVSRKISRERPKTKRAVLVKTPDVDDFENAFELVTESDLGQRRESEVSSGNDSVDTRTVSISISESIDHRHGSLASYPGEAIPPQQIQEEVHDQSNDDTETMENISVQDKTSKEKNTDESDTAESIENFESFVEDFNNEESNTQDIDSTESTSSESENESSDSSSGDMPEEVGEEKETPEQVKSSETENQENTKDEVPDPNEIKDLSIDHFSEPTNDKNNKQNEQCENSPTDETDAEPFEKINVSSYDSKEIEQIANDESYAEVNTENETASPSNGEDHNECVDGAVATDLLAVENEYVFCEENGGKEILTESYTDVKVDESDNMKDSNVCLPGDNSARSLSLSVESIDRLSTTGSWASDSSTKRPSISLSSERIYLENVPPTPTVIVQDSIIFEPETMHQIYLEKPDVHPLRGRRAYTLNDIHIEKKVNNADNNLPDSNSVKNDDTRYTSSPEIRDIKHKGFITSKRLSFDFNFVGGSSRSLNEPDSLQPEVGDDLPSESKGTFIDTTLDNALLDSTVIKTNMQGNESETIETPVGETEVNKDTIDKTNMFTSISSDISDHFEFSNSIAENKADILDAKINEKNHQIEENGSYKFEIMPKIDSELKDETLVGNMSFGQNNDKSTSAHTDSNNPVDTKTTETEMPTDDLILQHSSIIKDDNTLQLEFDPIDNKVDQLTPTKHEPLETFDEDFFSGGSKTPDDEDRPVDDNFTTPSGDDFASTNQNSDVDSDVSAEEENSASKKKVVAASFDFNTFENDSDSDSKSSSSTSASDDSDDEIRSSFELSTDEKSSVEDGETEGEYTFEKISKHSKSQHSTQLEIPKNRNKSDIPDSMTSSTLSWELLSRENSVDANKIKLGDKNDDDSTKSIESDGHLNLVTPDSHMTDKSMESAETSWDVVGGLDDNSEC